MKTISYLDAVKSRHGLKSDYQLGKFMDWGLSTVSGYRTGRRELSDDHCLQVAEALGLDVGEVLADIQAARAKTPETKRAWESVAKVFRGAAAVVLGVIAVAALVVGNPAPAQAAAQGTCERLLNRSIHYAQLALSALWVAILARWARRYSSGTLLVYLKRLRAFFLKPHRKTPLKPV